jgi:hypothetical protein
MALDQLSKLRTDMSAGKNDGSVWQRFDSKNSPGPIKRRSTRASSINENFGINFYNDCSTFQIKNRYISGKYDIVTYSSAWLIVGL